MSALTVPDGHAPPFSVVTPTDQSAWIIIATAFGLMCVLMFSIVRTALRSTVASRFALDDALLAAATVCLPRTCCNLQIRIADYHHLQVLSIVDSSITLYAASLGLGRSVELVNPDRLVTVQKVSRDHGPGLCIQV